MPANQFDSYLSITSVMLTYYPQIVNLNLGTPGKYTVVVGGFYRVGSLAHQLQIGSAGTLAIEMRMGPAQVGDS